MPDDEKLCREAADLIDTTVVDGMWNPPSAKFAEETRDALLGLADRIGGYTVLIEEAIGTIDGLWGQQAMPDYWWEDTQEKLYEALGKTYNRVQPKEQE